VKPTTRSGRRAARFRRGTGVAVVAVLLLAGCDGTTDDPAAPAAGPDEPADADDEAPAADADVALLIAGFAFDPPQLEVAAGAPIEVVNQDSATHTVTAEDGGFDLRLEGGGTGTIVVDEPGTYPYVCSIHPSMRGELTVS
jgi:plastocyanin